MLAPSSRSEEYLKRKRKILYIKMGLFLFVLVLIFIGLVYLSRIDRFRISNVEFSGGLLVSGQQVTKETLDFLNGNYFFFFPRNNVFLYPHDSLQNFLKDKFKRIDTISIDTDNQKTIRINITERGMYALWCGEDQSSESSEKCYFMDDNGVVFSKAPLFSGDAYFKFYGFLSTSTDPIGNTYLASTTKFLDISRFVDRVKNTTNIKPVGLLVKGDGEYDLLLSQEGKVYFDDLQSFDKTADNLETLLKTIGTSTDLTGIDYIDLRFGNKVFYKLKQ